MVINCFSVFIHDLSITVQLFELALFSILIANPVFAADDTLEDESIKEWILS